MFLRRLAEDCRRISIWYSAKSRSKNYRFAIAVENKLSAENPAAVCAIVLPKSDKIAAKTKILLGFIFLFELN